MRIQFNVFAGFEEDTEDKREYCFLRLFYFSAYTAGFGTWRRY